MTLLHASLGLRCETAWRDEHWVGAGGDELFKVVADQLDLNKPNILAERFDAREALLFTAPNAAVQTQDGSTYSGLFIAGLAGLSADEPPHWSR